MSNYYPNWYKAFITAIRIVMIGSEYAHVAYDINAKKWVVVTHDPNSPQDNLHYILSIDRNSWVDEIGISDANSINTIDAIVKLIDKVLNDIIVDEINKEASLITDMYDDIVE